MIYSQDAAWAWEKANWAFLEEKLGGDMSYDKFVIYPGNTFKTADKLAEYKAFFEPKLENQGLKKLDYKNECLAIFDKIENFEETRYSINQKTFIYQKL